MKRMITSILCLGIAVPILVLSQESPQTPSRVERSVVYGMYSGLALLMDVHYPQKANGYGILFIAGSAFYAPLSYEASQLKDSSQVQMYAKPLLEAGYTVFAINHRDPPRFRSVPST